MTDSRMRDEDGFLTEHDPEPLFPRRPPEEDGPRPMDPEKLYRAFTAHCQTCDSCRDQITPCPYGENLLMAWGHAEEHYANEQAMIERAKVEPPAAEVYGEDWGDCDDAWLSEVLNQPHRDAKS